MYFWRVLSLVTILRWLLCGWWRDFPVVSGEIIYWKIRFPRNFKYSPTLPHPWAVNFSLTLLLLGFLTINYSLWPWSYFQLYWTYFWTWRTTIAQLIYSLRGNFWRYFTNFRIRIYSTKGFCNRQTGGREGAFLN